MTGKRALHAALWRYDRSYRAAWFAGPLALVLLASGALLGPSGSVQATTDQPGGWVKAPAAAVDWGACTQDGSAAQPVAAGIVKACSDLEAKGGLRPEDAAALYFRRGLAYQQLRQSAAAIADFTRSIEFDPRNAAAYNSRGMGLEGRKDFPQAEADFTKAIALLPNNAMLYTSRADTRRFMRRYDEALADADTAVRLDPGMARAFWVRASINGEKKAWEPDLADATRALELQASFATARLTRAVAYTNLHRLDEAVADLTNVIASGEAVAVASLLRGRAYGRQQKLDLAEADFTRCLGLEPKNDACLLQRAHIRLQHGAPGPAAEDATAALAIVPELADASFVRGQARYAQGDFAESFADFDTAARQAPQAAVVKADRAVAFWRAQQTAQAACRTDGKAPGCPAPTNYPRARGYFDEMLGADPNSVGGLVGRGEVNLAAGDRALAEADWRKAAGLAPTNAHIRALLAQNGLKPP